MIKSEELLSRYNLQNGPPRLRVINSETRHFELATEQTCLEFEKLMLSMHLLEKYAYEDRQLYFETNLKNEMEQIGEEVESLYSFLTSQRLSIKFVQREQERQLVQKRLQGANQTANDGAPCLFSGGLDSATGAVSLMKDKRDPTLCHTATSKITMGKVIALHVMTPYSHLPLVITDMRTEAADSTSGKTRGLLFLSNAMVLASSLGRTEVFIPENGPLMINPAVSQLAEPTKNAHPYLLTTIEKIFNITTNSSLKINAIFKDKTKAEAIAPALDKRITDHTWSCFRIQGQSHMCGLCYACLVRRLSLLAVGYEEPADAYDYNPFALDRSKVKGVALKDLDILHDSIFFFEKLFKKENITEIDLTRMPNGFFKDLSGLLYRFSLDMFLGIKKLLQSSSHISTLGRFAINVMEDLPDSYLSEREEQLKTLRDSN